jgi:hypothetical protein
MAQKEVDFHFRRGTDRTNAFTTPSHERARLFYEFSLTCQVHSRLGSALLLSGDVPGAIAEYEKQRELAREEGQGREHYAAMLLAHLYGVNGNREKAPNVR